MNDQNMMKKVVLLCLFTVFAVAMHFQPETMISRKKSISCCRR